MQIPPYNPVHVNTCGLGCSRFARRYLGNRKDYFPSEQIDKDTVRNRTMSLAYCLVFEANATKISAIFAYTKTDRK